MAGPTGPAADLPGLSMIGFLSRFIGLWLIAGALVALVVDGTKTIASSSLTVTSLGATWATIGPATLMRAQEFVQRNVETYVGHWLWDPLIQWILMLPTWVVLTALGAGLVYVGRKRQVSTAFA